MITVNGLKGSTVADAKFGHLIAISSLSGQQFAMPVQDNNSIALLRFENSGPRLARCPDLSKPCLDFDLAPTIRVNADLGVFTQDVRACRVGALGLDRHGASIICHNESTGTETRVHVSGQIMDSVAAPWYAISWQIGFPRDDGQFVKIFEV